MPLVLEIVIITIVIIAAFIGTAWYALRRSKRNRIVVDKVSPHIEPEVNMAGAFDVVFKQEMAQQSVSDIDGEPVVSLSKKASSNVAISEPKQDEIDLTINDINTEQEIQQPDNTAVNDWDMMIAFTIMAAENQPFSGLDITAELTSSNLQFGDMQIYHRMAAGAHKTPLFSVANIIEPGTLNPQQLAKTTTPGLLIFAKLPSSINSLTLFEQLLETAQTLTRKLNGMLCDESRQEVNQNTLEAMRGRILSLNLTLQAEQTHSEHDYSN